MTSLHILRGPLLFALTEEGFEIVQHSLGEDLDEILEPGHPKFEEAWSQVSSMCEGIECFSLTPIGKGCAGKVGGRWIITCDLESFLQQRILAEEPSPSPVFH